MSTRENPVTRPSVYRTQDARYNASFSAAVRQRHQQPPLSFSGELRGYRAGEESSSLLPDASSADATTGGAVRPPRFGDPYNTPPTRTRIGNDTNNNHNNIVVGNGLLRIPSIRTFSQLSALPMTSPTSALAPVDTSGGGPVWMEYTRAPPIAPASSPGFINESGMAAAFAADNILQRPLGPDTVRDAVLAYLEATDRHDVVAAMLADEKRHAQRTGVMTAPVESDGGAFSRSPSPKDRSAGASRGLGTTLRNAADARNTAGEARLSSQPSSPSHDVTLAAPASALMSGGSALNRPPSQTFNAAARARAGGTTEELQLGATAGGVDPRRKPQRRAHELLCKGLMARHRWDGEVDDDCERPPRMGRIAVPSPGSPRRGHSDVAGDTASTPSSPRYSEASGRSSAPHAAKSIPSLRQHLPKLLPTLCGLDEAVRPDLIILFADLEAKILEQYRQLSIPPPSHEVLQYIVTQSYEPMWSVGEDANAYHLLQPSNPVTGMVLYGTLNQMVEQLTQVHVMPLSTPSPAQVKGASAFEQAFLRRHRLLMPSHALLAKLMERYLVPLSLRLGFERFRVHGITVHIPGLGASLPPQQSQSETVLHGRRHLGTATAANSGAGGQTRSGGTDGAPWGVRPSRHAQEQAGGATLASGRSYGTSTTAVDDYVRATAAATSPDAALMAMLRSGMFPTMTSATIAAVMNASMPAGPASPHSSTAASVATPRLNNSPGLSFPASATLLGAAGVNGAGGILPRLTGELVSTYSTSATLWLHVCQRVQLKVMSTLLYWLQHHPHHFDTAMLRSVLHFVESCCYAPCAWADAPSRQPQMAEFIRQACNRALKFVARRASANGAKSVNGCAGANGYASTGTFSALRQGSGTNLQFKASPPVAQGWLDGVLSGTYERRRYQLLCEVTPPSLRQALRPELMPWTWVTPMGSLTPAEYLPRFAFRTLPSADAMMSYPVDTRDSGNYASLSHQRHGGHTGNGIGGMEEGTRPPSDFRCTGGVPETRLHQTAQAALDSFGNCTFETYVRGLTAAHYRMFTTFSSQDIFIAAQHTGSSYLNSPLFQNSFLGRFLNSSALLTSWCVSLLLHAAYLDGEKTAAAAVVTNLSILNSFVGTIKDAGRMALPSEGEGEGGASMGRSPDSSMSSGSSSLTTASVATASASAASQTGGNGAGGGMAGGGGEGGGGVVAQTAAAQARFFAHNPARQFLHVLDRLVDLVVGFLRVNNLHASYSIFRGFQHPFVRRLLQHRKVRMHIHIQTGHRLRKLAGFFTSIPPSSEGAERRERSHDDDTTAANAAGVGDGVLDEEVAGVTSTTTGPVEEGQSFTTGAPSAAPTPQSKVSPAPRRSRKTHHTFFEYLTTVPDSVEYPTVPVVQYYLRELQMMFALEPTFFTVPSHQMQSRFVSEEVRLRGLFSVPDANISDEQQEAFVSSPIAVVNWRKLHLVDDWIQRVSSNQMSCLHYISSRSTVVRNISPDLDFEKTFDAQLGCVVVTNTVTLQEMANQLYSCL